MASKGYKKRRSGPPPTRRILVLRHAKSSWKDPALADFERPLAPRGKRAAAAMGAYLRDHGLAPDVVLCSAARRATQTWDRLASVIGGDPEVRIEDDLYLASPEQLLERLRRLAPEVATVLLVGHNPSMEILARELAVTGDPRQISRLRTKFPTAALAVVDVALEAWSDLRLGAGALAAFVVPKDVR